MFTERQLHTRHHVVALFHGFLRQYSQSHEVRSTVIRLWRCGSRGSEGFRGLPKVPPLIPGAATTPALELVPSRPGSSWSRSFCTSGKREGHPRFLREARSQLNKAASTQRTLLVQPNCWSLSQGKSLTSNIPKAQTD